MGVEPIEIYVSRVVRDIEIEHTFVRLFVGVNIFAVE